MTPRTDPASEPLAGTFPVPAASATPLGAVIRAMVLLRLRALLRPKLFLRFAGFAVGIGAVTWFAVPPANERQFAQWSVEVFLLRILPLLCLVTGGSALRDEIRAFTIEYLWTRPARKADLVIGAYAGALALTLTQGVVYVLVIHATSALHGFPGAWSYLPGSLLATIGGVFAFTALAHALGVLTGKYLVIGVLYGALVEIGLSRLPTRLNNVSVTHHLQTLIESAGTGGEPMRIAGLLSGALGCALIAAAGLAAAAVLFTMKTYRIGDEKET
jgi:hypothetical protein